MKNLMHYQYLKKKPMNESCNFLKVRRLSKCYDIFNDLNINSIKKFLTYLTRKNIESIPFNL